MKTMASSILRGNRLAWPIYLMCCLGAITYLDQATAQSSSQRTAADSKAIQALKGKVAAIAKSYPNPNQSEAKVKAVLAAITAFAEANPGLVPDAVQAAITEMGATNTEVGAIVSGAIEIAPGEAKAIANGALAVAGNAFAEIQAAAPGVSVGPGGDPLGSPGGGGTGGSGGSGGSGDSGGAGGSGGVGGSPVGSNPVITPPNVTRTGFTPPR
jgi:uncharacterized membrane protein YgcG